MSRFAFAATAVATAALVLTPGCRRNDEALTLGEATAALEEASVSSQAGSVMSGSVEITTDFTIGGAVADAAGEIRDRIASQLPCAEVTLQNATLSIEYGANPGNCTYNGHTYSGSHTVTVSSNDMDEVIVEHAWESLSNGVVSVTGDATVTWNAADVTRHVEHSLTWTRLSDGKEGTGTGDRLQQALPGGIAEGFQVDGTRTWTGEKGSWQLAIDGVQMRWADPVPQAGSYTLVTPENKELTLQFERLDSDTIQVTLDGTKNTFTLKVSSAGAIDEA